MATAAHFAALRLIRHAATYGVDEAQSCAWLGLPDAASLARPGRLPLTRMFQGWASLRAATGDAAVAVRASCGWTLDDLGVLGFALAAAPTVRDAIDTALRFIGVVSDEGRWSSTLEHDRLRLTWSRPGPPTPGRALSDEVMVTGFAHCARLLSGAPALRVSLGGARELGAREALLGCPVTRGEDAVELDRALLEIRPPTASRALWTFLCELAAAERPATRTDDAMATRVSAVLTRALDDGRAAELREAARALATSERSLRRRLAEEGTSFRRLAEEARVSRALRLLARPGARVGEVAAEVGYADATSLGRAVRRARGVPPSRALR